MILRTFSEANERLSHLPCSLLGNGRTTTNGERNEKVRLALRNADIHTVEV